MSSLVWLVHWTGRSVIVCVRNRAVAAACGRDDLIRPYLAWSLADGAIVRVPLSAVEASDLQAAVSTARQRLSVLSSRMGENFRQFGDITVNYQPYPAREHWLGSPVDLRQRLVAETRDAENDHLLNRH